MKNSDLNTSSSSTQDESAKENDVKCKEPEVLQFFEDAKNLISLLTSDEEDKVHQAEIFIQSHKYEQHYQPMFWDLVRLLKDNRVYLNRFFELFFRPPRDLIGDYEALFLMRCLDEGEYLELIDDKYKQTIMFVVQDIIWRDIISDKSHSKMVLYGSAVMKSEQVEAFLIGTLISPSDLTNKTLKFINRMLPTFYPKFINEELVPQLINMLQHGSRKYHFEILRLLKTCANGLPHSMRIELMQKVLPPILLSRESGELTYTSPKVRTSPQSNQVEVLPPTIFIISDRAKATKLYYQLLSTVTLEERVWVIDEILLPLLDTKYYYVIIAIIDLIFSFSKDVSNETIQRLTEFHLPLFFNDDKLDKNNSKKDNDNCYINRNINIAGLLFKHYDALSPYLMNYLMDEILPVLFSKIVSYDHQEKIAENLLQYQDKIPPCFAEHFSKCLNRYKSDLLRNFTNGFREELMRSTCITVTARPIWDARNLSSHELLQIPLVEQIFTEILAMHKVHLSDYQIKAKFILFEFYIANFDKIKEPLMAKLVFTVLKQLNSYDWVLVQPYNRYDSLKKYFSLSPSLDHFETVVTQFFINPIKNWKDIPISAIIKKLFNLLPLQRILMFSSFHQFEHFWKDIFEYARENNMAIFVEKNENDQYFLHCQGNDLIKVPVDKEVVKTMQWNNHEKSLVKMVNDSSQVDLFKEKDFNLNSEIYKKATSYRFSQSPNSISYQKSRDEIFSASDQASSSSSHSRVAFHSNENKKSQSSKPSSNEKRRCIVM